MVSTKILKRHIHLWFWYWKEATTKAAMLIMLLLFCFVDEQTHFARNDWKVNTQQPALFLSVKLRKLCLCFNWGLVFILRGKGLIINISSEAASQPQPMVSVYSATKVQLCYTQTKFHLFKYLNKMQPCTNKNNNSKVTKVCLTLLLHPDICYIFLSQSACRIQVKRNHGSSKPSTSKHLVEKLFAKPWCCFSSSVQCVAPFMVSTNMTHNMPVNPLVKSAASFARDALNTVGYTTYTSGCLTHALQVNTTHKSVCRVWDGSFHTNFLSSSIHISTVCTI